MLHPLRRVARGAWGSLGVLAVASLLASCFKSTPVTPSPASPEEANAIHEAMSGTVWYDDTYTDDSGKNHDGAEAFIFVPNGKGGFDALATFYRAGFNSIGDRVTAFKVELKGKNAILQAETAYLSRALRFDRASADELVLFEYDLTRTHHLIRLPPDAKGKTITAPSGDYAVIYTYPDSLYHSHEGSPPNDCELERGSDTTVAGKCKFVNAGAFAGRDWTVECAPADAGFFGCTFTHESGKVVRAPQLKLNPEGSLVGQWIARVKEDQGLKEVSFPIAMLRKED
jgi:hypothetical protein